MNEPVSQEKSQILNEYSKAIELIEANLTVKKHIVVSYCAVFILILNLTPHSLGNWFLTLVKTLAWKLNISTPLDMPQRILTVFMTRFWMGGERYDSS